MNQSIQELIQKNKSHAIDLSEASDIMPKDLKEHQIRIYNAVLDSEYLSNEHLKDLIDAVIEDEDTVEFGEAKFENDMDNKLSDGYTIGYNQAKQDTIKKLQAIKKLL